jgi:hypothetical protein
MRFRDWIWIPVSVVVIASTALACSSDYVIWMIRTDSSDALFRFIRNGKAGYIDRTGKIVVPPTLETSGNYGGEFHDGRLKVSTKGDEWYIDTSGKRVNRPKFYGWDFYEGLAAAKMEPNGKWGFVDTTGTFVIAPQFDGYPAGSVDSFSNGFAKITKGERDGYIDRTGAFAIPPQFLQGARFHDDRAWVVVDGPCMYFTPGAVCPDYGKLPRSASDAQVGQSLCKYALIDKTGTVLSKERFDSVGDFSEGLAPVRIGGYWGFVDAQGTVVIQPRFQQATSFSDGLAMITFNSIAKPEYGFINHDGVIVIPPQFAAAESFSEGLAMIAPNIEGPYSFIDKKGERAFDGKFVVASSFAKGLAHVKLFSPDADENNRFNPYGPYAYIDRTGREVFRYTR